MQVMAQKTKEAEITEQDSLLLTRNLLRIAIYNISYIIGLFPEKYFNDKSVPALEMKIKKLMPLDSESRRLIVWMEKGVYDALQKKYLKNLLFCICEKEEGPMIEEYAFAFSYPNSKGEEISMNMSCTGSKKNSATFKSSAAEVTPDQMRSSACKMIRTLVSLMRTLDQMLDEPEDYEPPFFKGCADNEAINIWNKNPLNMEVGSVNSKHLVLALKVKSVLDPCEANNVNSEDDNMSLGHESDQDHDDDFSDTEVRPSEVDRYVVAPNDGNCKGQSGSVSEEDTQDPAHEEAITAQVREWICSRDISSVHASDVVSNFPDISMEMVEDILEKLLKDGLISRASKDSYAVNKIADPRTPHIKKEVLVQNVSPPEGTKSNYQPIHQLGLRHTKYISFLKLAMVMLLLASGCSGTKGAIPSSTEQMPHTWCDAHRLATLVVRSCFGQPDKPFVGQGCCAAIFLSTGQHKCFCKIRSETFFHLSPLSNVASMSTIMRKCNANGNLFHVLDECPDSNPNQPAAASAPWTRSPSADTHHVTSAISPTSTSSTVSAPSPATDCTKISEARENCVGLLVTALFGWICVLVALCVIGGQILYFRRMKTNFFHKLELCKIPALHGNCKNGDQLSDDDDQPSDDDDAGGLDDELFADVQDVIEQEPELGKGKRSKQENVRLKGYVSK